MLVAAFLPLLLALLLAYRLAPGRKAAAAALLALLLLAAAAAALVLIEYRAPLEEPAHPASTPNPSREPWYFLGFREALIDLDPWLLAFGAPWTAVCVLLAAAALGLELRRQEVGAARRERRRLAARNRWLTAATLAAALTLAAAAASIAYRQCISPRPDFFAPFENWRPEDGR
jgi:hypothetical protein